MKPAKSPGATRRRTLLVLLEFLTASHFIDEVALQLSMSPRTVTRMVADALRVGYMKRPCSCGRFALEPSRGVEKFIDELLDGASIITGAKHDE